MIIPFDNKFTEAVRQIANETLGHGFLTSSVITGFVAEESVLLLDVDQQQIVRAFSFSLCLPVERLLKEFRIPECVISPGNTRLALLKTIACDPKHQHKGIASSLIDKTLEELKARQIHECLVLAWTTARNTNIRPLLERFSFREVIKLPNYWYEDSLRYKYDCPECGHPPCRCSAFVFAKSLRGAAIV